MHFILFFFLSNRTIFFSPPVHAFRGEVRCVWMYPHFVWMCWQWGSLEALCSSCSINWPRPLLFHLPLILKGRSSSWAGLTLHVSSDIIQRIPTRLFRCLRLAGWVSTALLNSIDMKYISIIYVFTSTYVLVLSSLEICGVQSWSPAIAGLFRVFRNCKTALVICHWDRQLDLQC